MPLITPGFGLERLYSLLPVDSGFRTVIEKVLEQAIPNETSHLGGDSDDGGPGTDETDSSTLSGEGEG